MDTGTETFAGRTVVVVNDDKVMLNLLAGLLSKLGLTATTFTGVEPALASLTQGTAPDLIVTDLHMPGIDGWRFCRLLRSPEFLRLNRIPVLVVSSTFAGDELKRVTTGLGANAFLSVPASMRALREHVRALLEGTTAPDPATVLIVEDCVDVARMLHRAFEARGYIVHLAETGADARELMRHHRFDIAIVDYHLPDGLGDRLIEEMRSQHPGLAIVMVTADTSPELATRCMRLGASAYVRKPFDIQYLVDLAEHARRERALLRVEDLLDERTRELRRSEEMFRFVFDHTHEGMAVHRLELHPDGRPADYVVLDANPRYREILNLPAGEIAGRRASTLFAPSEPPFLAEYAAAVRLGAPRRFEAYFAPARRHLLVSVTPHHASQFATILFDITSHKHAQERLSRLSQCLVQPGPDHAANVTGLVELGGQLLHADAALYLRLGQDRVELAAAWNLPEVLVLDDAAQACLRREILGCACGDAAVLPRTDTTANGATAGCPAWPWRTGMLQAVRLGEAVVGGLCVVHQNAVELTAEDRHLLSLLATAIGAEEERRRAEDVYALLSRRLEQKNRELEEVIYATSHDLRTPMVNVQGFGQVLAQSCADLQRLLADAVLPPDQKSAIDAIVSQRVPNALRFINTSTAKMNGLVSGLLELSRTGSIALRIAALDMDVVLAQLLESIRYQIQDAGAAFEVGQLPKCAGDPTQINRVFMNLFGNALRYRDSSRPLLVKVDGWTREGQAVYCVSDNGTGIPPESLDRIWVPFNRLQRPGGVQGEGIGLALVRRLVERHQGQVWAESESGVGSRFYVSLPMATGA